MINRGCRQYKSGGGAGQGRPGTDPTLVANTAGPPAPRVGAVDRVALPHRVTSVRAGRRWSAAGRTPTVVPCQTSWHLSRAPVPGSWHRSSVGMPGRLAAGTRSGGRHALCPSSVMRCCRAWSHPFTAPAPTSSGRPAVPTSWHGCQVGAKKLAQVPFSLARDNGRCPREDLAECDSPSYWPRVERGIGRRSRHAASCLVTALHGVDSALLRARRRAFGAKNRAQVPCSPARGTVALLHHGQCIGAGQHADAGSTAVNSVLKIRPTKWRSTILRCDFQRYLAGPVAVILACPLGGRGHFEERRRFGGQRRGPGDRRQ
jgi:hypothetical protein